MTQESLVYAINLAIGAILAALMTQQWRREEGESSLGAWTAALWIMTAADVLFAVRPMLPYWVGRLIPTLMVTVGHGVLLLGAQRTARRPVRRRVVVAVVAVHAVLLTAFLVAGGTSSWRTVLNGVIWGGLSIASFVLLRRAPDPLRRMMAIPAFVFLAHGAFHATRLSLAAVAAVQHVAGGSWLQMMGDFEVSLFMVALFVSLLAAHLQLRNLELRAALDDVRQLSGLLPLCAWCHKVRDDDGYWLRIEHYFAARRQVQFTHGICENCAREQVGASTQLPPHSPPRT